MCVMNTVIYNYNRPSERCLSTIVASLSIYDVDPYKWYLHGISNPYIASPPIDSVSSHLNEPLV